MNDDFINQAKEFDNFAENSYPWKFIELPTLTSILSSKITKDTNVLDLGSGGGRIIRLAEKVGVLPENIVGIDFSSELIELAKGRSPNVLFIQGDIANPSVLESAQKEFDIVTSVHVFEHLDLEEMRQSITNSYNMTRPSGYFVCLVGHPFRYSEKDTYNNNYWYKQITPWGKEVSHYHKTISDYINTFIKAGYKIEEVIEPKVSELGKEDLAKFNDYNRGASRLILVCRK